MGDGEHREKEAWVMRTEMDEGRYRGARGE